MPAPNSVLSPDLPQPPPDSFRAHDHIACASPRQYLAEIAVSPPSVTLLALAIALQILTAGCQNREGKAPAEAGVGAVTAEATPAGPQDAGPLLPPERPYPAKFYYLDLAGREDFRNRYSARVEVTTSRPTLAGINGWCSGVLLGPEWVLTAGHCVCMRRPTTAPGSEGKLIIDGASCSLNPSVTASIWAPSTGDDFIPSASWSETYSGIDVRPHPDFQIVLDQEGRVVSSRADLALILLETPIERKYTPVQLADEEIQSGETFVLVGGTSSEGLQGGLGWGDRRFMRYKTVGFMGPGSDRVLFEQPGRELFKGDSGGPCVRENPKGPLLVGISARGLGTKPTFTSIHPYRDWLRTEIRSVKPK